jgi:hypothetical protein
MKGAMKKRARMAWPTALTDYKVVYKMEESISNCQNSQHAKPDLNSGRGEERRKEPIEEGAV